MNEGTPLVKPLTKLKLHGFNNLTKTLSFNIYDICYAKTASQRRDYIEYIDEVYNAERLTQILTDVSNIIGATVLNVARQDYDPQGASVTMLISEEPVVSEQLAHDLEGPGPLPDAVVAHLDKSHITVHTYPESHPDNGISTFRADIDVSTCGRISPLKALNYLIHSFESDIVIMDYRVRGFTRDVRGKRHFIDHRVSSIQGFVSKDGQRRYHIRCEPHEALDRRGQFGSACGERTGRVLLFFFFHLFEYRAALVILLRQAREVLIVVAHDLSFGLHHEAEAPLVAGETRGRADRKRARVPERIEQTRVAAELGEALFAPREMIVFLERRAFHLFPHIGQFRREALALIQRLRRDLARVIDSHESGGNTPLVVVQRRLGLAVRGIGSVRGDRRAEDRAPGLVEMNQ